MKKEAFLLVFILISTLVFSQKKENIDGIEIVKHKNTTTLKGVGDRFNGHSFISTIRNNKNNPLINQIDKLELEYLNLKAKQIRNSFKNEFYRIEGHQGKTSKSKDDVFEAYINYLAIEIKELHIKISVEEKSEYRSVSERLRHKERANLKKEVKIIEKEKQ